MLFGSGVGFGADYEFDSGIVCSINPYVRGNFGFTQDYFLQSGISFGVGYKF
jgi:hypothetical protein